jgi:ABC-2 type transport system permease protein
LVGDAGYPQARRSAAAPASPWSGPTSRRKKSPTPATVTAIVDTLRALLAQGPVGGDIWVALAWLLGILVLGYATALTHYRRKVR